MARWFYNAPPAEAALSERKIAELWHPLGDGFFIRWGFSYRIDHGVWREGDFLVQGPDGHILVVEAKPGEPAPDPATGVWTTADGENPFVQLDREWNGVLSLLQQQAEMLHVTLPFVGSALALPDACLPTSQLVFAGQPRARVLDQTDLKDFAAWWKKTWHGLAILPWRRRAGSLNPPIGTTHLTPRAGRRWILRIRSWSAKHRRGSRCWMPSPTTIS